MNGHPQFEEGFDCYALGVLDADEKLAIESHVATCPECARKLAEARERAGWLAATVEPAAPLPRVKQRLMARIGARAAERRESLPQAWWQRTAAAWALAALTLALAIFFGLRDYRLNREILTVRSQAQQREAALARARAVLELLTAPDTQGITLTAMPAKPQPQGKVFYHPSRGLVFYASNLAAPPPGRAYQLWLVPTSGSPISAGVFEPDQKGDASILLPALPSGVSAQAFAVTVEPAGGVPQPTGPKMLVGAAAP